MPSRKIEDAVPALREKWQLLKEVCASKGISIVLTNVSRTAQEQEALYAQGRCPLSEVNAMRAKLNLWPITDKENERPITWTLNSKHIINRLDKDLENDYSRAFDFAIVHDGKASWDVKADVNQNQIADYAEVGQIGEQLGLKWGGKFKDKNGNPLPDYCHFEVRP